jgi:hypothetical protein
MIPKSKPLITKKLPDFVREFSLFTQEQEPYFLFFSSKTACAAARRAIGTRNGLQLT